MSYLVGTILILVFICGLEFSYEKDGKKTYIIRIKPLSERLK
jgi:hypothetical protein